MDYPQNREEYLKKYQEFSNSIVLNDSLKNSVQEFSNTIWETEEEVTDETIKSYILLELTKTRETCGEVIRLLRESEDPTKSNSRLAKHIEGFNTSPGRQRFGNEVNIPVTPVVNKNIKKTNTKHHGLAKPSRGKAIIFNIVADEVKRETQRFEHIFKELMFETEVHLRLTTTQIKDKLTTIAQDLADRAKGQRDEAVIVYIITHGQNEQIKGINHPDCGGSDPNDIIPICVIVDLFAKVKDTKKMFFFTCCRHIETNDVRDPNSMNCSKCDDSDSNTNTHIFYSCAEGYETYHNGLYTLFGKVLSESIAQYAHSENLNEIIQRTNQEIVQYFPTKRNSKIGYFAPENRGKCTTHNLYFNPGWCTGIKN